MYIAIDDLLKKKNKKRYWLAKETGIAYKNIANLCNNKTTSIKFDVLKVICNVLECEPNDIIKFK